MITRPHAGALLLGILGSCKSDDDVPTLAPIPSTPPTLSVEVGTGSIDYQPLAEGDRVELVHGSQGGWHIWTGARVREPSPPDARINLFARFADTGESAGDPSSVAVRLDPTGDGSRAAAGMRNFISDPVAVIGKRLVLRVEVVADDGRHGASERAVVAR